MFTTILLLLLFTLIPPTLTQNDATHIANSKPRLFILSDILNEPDDSQSLVRYLLYANEFQTEGLVAVTSTWLPNETHPEAIRDIIRAYGDVVGNLNHHLPRDRSYPSAEELMGVVFSGPNVYGKQALNTSTPLSPGAHHLITRLHASTTTFTPLNLAIWGGTNTLAQALQHITTTLPPSQASLLRSHLRIYAISDQDDTGAWIRATYPDLFYVVSRHAWRAYALSTWTGISKPGISAAANDSVIGGRWLERNIQQKGQLGRVYPDIENIMEGDSPSLLYFIPNGLGSPGWPEWGSWGGRYASVSDGGERQYGDTLDTVYYQTDDSSSNSSVKEETSNQATIWRWRSAFQNDFAARMQWTLSPEYTTARHPPIIDINGHSGLEPLMIHVKPNQTLVFDASGTVDTDAHHGQDYALQFEWFQYQEASYLPAPPAPEDERLVIQPVKQGQEQQGEVLGFNEQGFCDVVRAQKVRVRVPAKQTVSVIGGYHLVLQVSTVGGEFPITRYKRVVLVP